MPNIQATSPYVGGYPDFRGTNPVSDSGAIGNASLREDFSLRKFEASSETDPDEARYF